MQRVASVIFIAFLAAFPGCSGSESDPVDTPGTVNLDCGNGQVDPGEECDDGADNSDTAADACRTDCSLASCGDGVVDATEECDDGADNSDTAADACRTDCSPPVCGDDVIDTGEECDDGNDDNGDGCVEGCQQATCGDGFLRLGLEECDDGADNSDTAADACRTDCSPPVCGDDVVDTGEECDDGNDSNADSCSNACIEISFLLGPFTAEYYSNDTLIYTEQVDRPAIEYAWSDFHNITSENFHAIWTGPLEVISPDTQTIDINFDMSWSDLTLTIDSVLVGSYTSSGSVTHDFAPGTHEIVIEYNNNWHTTGFYASFTKNVEYETAEAAVLLQPLVANDPVFFYVGGYEPDDLYREIDVNVVGSSSPLLLFFSTNEACHWNLTIADGVEVVGVVYSAASPRPTISTNRALPLIEVQQLRYGYDDFTNTIADITALGGKAPDHVYGEYGIAQATIDLP